jgi:hypothetical protein
MIKIVNNIKATFLVAKPSDLSKTGKLGKRILSRKPKNFCHPNFPILFISSNFCKIPRKEPPQLPGSFSAGKKISCYRVDSI